MIRLSDKWAERLVSQPETGIGYQIATVILKDGRRIEQVTVIGGVISSAGGVKELTFTEADIIDIVVTHGR